MGGITDFVNQLGSVEERVVVNIVLGYLDANAPFLKLPIINTITTWIVSTVVNIIFSKLELGVIQIATIIKTAGQESDFTKAAQANIDAQKGADDAKKQKAQKDLLEAARNFGRIITP